MLVLGLLAGGVIVFGAMRDRAGPGIAEIQVNGAPAKVPAAAAVDVASRLGPAVGTIIAALPGSTGLGSGFVIAKDSVGVSDSRLSVSKTAGVSFFRMLMDKSP